MLEACDHNLLDENRKCERQWPPLQGCLLNPSSRAVAHRLRSLCARPMFGGRAFVECRPSAVGSIYIKCFKHGRLFFVKTPVPLQFSIH